jgi:hypothetical protein
VAAEVTEAGVAEVTEAGVAEVTEVVAAHMAAAAISEAGVTEDMVDVGGTVVAEDMVAIGAAMVATVVMEGEEATDITEVTAVGAGAALASGSDSITRRYLFTIRRFGARTARLITTPMITTINGKEVPTSMKL